jgi:SprT protein
VTILELEEALARHIPQNAVKACAEMITAHKVQLKISRNRLTKFGDYRAPHNGYGHRISINHNLNPYAFLVTFIHEMAHLTTFNSFRHSVNPHGREWKNSFKVLLDPMLHENIFPPEIKAALHQYMTNPSATNCGDPVLHKALKNYDQQDHYTYLENLPEGCQFKLKSYDGIYIKGKFLRKTFHCKLVGSKREFRISGIARVQQITLF